MQVTIIGVGAMGSLFAGRLSHLADITLVGSWEAHINILNNKGLTLIHPDGRTTQHRLNATSDPAAVDPADLVLILVKAPNTAAAAQTAVSVVKADGLVLTLQNGLGNLETIAAVVGVERAVQGVTSEGAAVLEAGVVRHAGAGQSYLARSGVGTAGNSERRLSRLEQVSNLFNKAGFETRLVDKADSLIWGKLAVNAGINPLTALLQVPNGFLVENEEARWLMRQTAAEAAAVAEALGISLPYAEAAERAEAVARATAANRSSMAQDVSRGVETEIEAICGAVVADGRRVGVPTPFNGVMRALVKAMSSKG